MNARDIIKAQWDAGQRGALAMWTIYDRPTDHPDGVIARRFEVAHGKMLATHDTLTGDLEDIRKTLWEAGLMKLSRQEGDEPQIVESWV